MYLYPIRENPADQGMLIPLAKFIEEYERYNILSDDGVGYLATETHHYIQYEVFNCIATLAQVPIELQYVMWFPK